jgi:hypothetical protein
VLLRIGPVPSGAARVWTGHHLGSLAALRDQLDQLLFSLPVEVLEAFALLLAEWNRHSATGPVFEWQQVMDPLQVRMLVQYWANLDYLSDDQVEALGLSWSPPEGAEFVAALAEAVAVALGGDDSRARFAASLVDNDIRPA